MLHTLRRPSLHDSAAFLCYLLPIALAFSRGASDGLLSAVAILFLAHSTIHKDWRWLRTPWLWFALAFWAYAMLIGIFAERPDKAITRAALWIRYPLFAVALAYWVRHAPHFWKRLIITWTGSVAFLIGDTYLQYFTGKDLLGREAIPDLHMNRLTGPYSSARVGISLLWLGLPLVVYWFCTTLYPKREWKRFAFAALLLLGFCSTILISGERMALMLCGLGLLVTLLLAPGKLKRYSLLGLAAGCALLAAIAATNPSITGRHITETQMLMEDFGNTHYGLVWGSARDVILEHPVTGVGLRHFREECPKAQYGPEPERRCERHPHNRYLELASETGLIGIALWLGMMVFWLRDGLKHLFIDRADFLLLGLVAALCVRLWPIASTTSIFISWSAVPFWLVIGLLYSRVYVIQSEKDEP